MSIGKNEIDQIKEIPVMEVATRLQIKIRGRKAICFGGHDRRTPSLSFEPRRNIWKCFGCEKKGDNIKLVMEVLKCDFRAALNWFADEFDMPLSGLSRFSESRKQTLIRKPLANRRKVPPRKDHRDQAFCVDTELYTWFIEKCRQVQTEQGRKYLRGHGIPETLAERFYVRELQEPSRTFRELVEKWGTERVFRSGISWGDDKGKAASLIWTSYALLFPFMENDHIIYIQGRLFQGTRKFVNPQGIVKPLFNRARLYPLPRGSTVHICEGVPDAIAMEGAGFPAVAVLGASSFRPEWVDDFLDFEVVLMPDGDAGGNVFASSVSEWFQKRGKAVQIIQAPRGEDVSSVIVQITLGRERT